jgi:hypothetical protein
MSIYLRLHTGLKIDLLLSNLKKLNNLIIVFALKYFYLIVFQNIIIFQINFGQKATFIQSFDKKNPSKEQKCSSDGFICIIILHSLENRELYIPASVLICFTQFTIRSSVNSFCVSSSIARPTNLPSFSAVE